MTSEGESRQQSIWEHREPEGGSGKPAPAPPKAPGEPRLQAVNRRQMAWRVYGRPGFRLSCAPIPTTGRIAST